MATAAYCLQGRKVAPLAGSVDRNIDQVERRPEKAASLPSRGAWIEIRSWEAASPFSDVAPLAGSVDRNYICPAHGPAGNMSLPSRGAWIEMGDSLIQAVENNCRSPRGERG